MTPFNPEHFETHIFLSTCPITQHFADGQRATSTGFYYQVQLAANKKLMLVVSAKHAFDLAGGPIELLLHRANEDGESGPDFTSPYVLRFHKYGPFYSEHAEVDLACLNISTVLQKLQPWTKWVSQENLADFRHDGMRAGREVWFPGYPRGKIDWVHGLPILRRGYIASIPQLNYGTDPAFLIDAEVHAGSSGSPVFLTLDRVMKLAGVISRRHFGTYATVGANAREIGASSIDIGLGTVIKADKLRELGQSALQRVLSAPSDLLVDVEVRSQRPLPA